MTAKPDNEVPVHLMSKTDRHKLAKAIYIRFVEHGHPRGNFQPKVAAQFAIYYADIFSMESAVYPERQN